MTSRRTQTNFTAGELDPLLAGRLDIRAVQEGCSRLRNVIVQSSGGMTRRPGTRFVRQLAAGDRMIGLEFSGGSALIVLSAGRVQVLENENLQATLNAPWTAPQVPAVRWMRRGIGLLLAHPDVEPQELSRDAGGIWALRPVAFHEVAGTGSSMLTRKAFHRFVGPELSIQPVYGSQSPADAIPADKIVTLKVSKAVFTTNHISARLRIRGRQVTITNVTSATQAIARTDQPLIDGQATLDWQEEAWSAARGWPAGFALHQERLVVTGSRDLPDRLWLSRSGSHLDFDFGTGLADEAISFALTADRRHEITAAVSSRHLQILTTAGEWVVRGAPLTPTSAQVEQQTSIGSRTSPHVAPLSVDGATLFIGATGRELREFLFTDTEQAYQAADLAVLCRHLLSSPVDMAFDPMRRLLMIVRGDGRVATITLDRTSNIVAWTMLEMVGQVRSITVTATGVYFLVGVADRTILSRFDATTFLDHAISRTSAAPSLSWTGLEHLNDQPVTIIEGTRVVAEQVVNNGSVTAPEALKSVTIGTRSTLVAEAMPLPMALEGAALDSRYRTIRASFRLKDTQQVEIDLGQGILVHQLPATSAAAQDLSLRGLGWRRVLEGPAWRIEQSHPSPLTLLAVNLELKVPS